MWTHGTGDRGQGDIGCWTPGFARAMTDAPAICKAGDADGVLLMVLANYGLLWWK